MVVIATLASDFATGIGLRAGAIATGGFLAHARPVLSGASESRVQRATVRGGLVGLALGALVNVLSAILDMVIA
jgi:hypothetical protein